MTRQDIMDYANTHGRQAAADLLLLAGPDGYEDADYDELERILNDAE